jgi:hypothetical protein
MQWKAEVERVSNGFLLTTFETNDVGEEVKETIVIQMKESFTDEQNRLSELKATKELLFQIIEYFGMHHNKHSKYNIEITIEGVKDDG